MMCMITYPPILNYLQMMTSLFLVAPDKKTSAKEINNDLREINNWAYQ